ncbi:MAG: DUF3465 domain-containing protein [Steroidobacteraceae bacterium]
MKQRILILAALLLVLLLGRGALNGGPAGAPPATGADVASASADGGAVSRAYADRASGVEVSGAGVVVKVLPDDVDGSPHQRFLLELPGGPTVLVAHNIDLAPRVPGLAAGDAVEFHGVYEWNPKGGVIHWTHGDPGGRHEAGWLRVDGQTYQ